MKKAYLVLHADITVGDEKFEGAIIDCRELRPGHQKIEYNGVCVPINIAVSGITIFVSDATGELALAETWKFQDVLLMKLGSSNGLNQLVFGSDNFQPLTITYKSGDKTRVKYAIEWHETKPEVFKLPTL